MSSAVAIGVACLALACSERSGLALSPSGAPEMKTGTWAGAQAELRVEQDQKAELDLPCAHGRIDRPLTINQDGAFEWRGRFTQERPGPTPEGGHADADARFRGSLDGDRLTLTVLVEGRTVAGPLTLDFGKRTRIVKCG